MRPLFQFVTETVPARWYHAAGTLVFRCYHRDRTVLASYSFIPKCYAGSQQLLVPMQVVPETV